MKKDWKKSIIGPSASIQDVMRTINDSKALKIAFVIDDNQRLLGTVTDGDIRRGIMKGISLEEPLKHVMNPHPVTVSSKTPPKKILLTMQRQNLSYIPVLNEQGQVTRVEVLNDLLQPAIYDNWVVVMVGGLGSRLQPMTNDRPKPLLKIGDKPLLETILKNFVDQGFHRFYFSVNYKAEMIEEYFGNGSKWGVEISYIRENKPLGTAGGLSLLPKKLEHPFFVVNGDLLTKVDLTNLLDFHLQHKAIATMCVREYDFQIPYGVIEIDEHHITHIEEKPIHRFFVNAGIYLLQPEVLDLIPIEKLFDMPNLFECLIQKGLETVAFPIREYWIDIGHKEDFEKANGDFHRIFG